MRHLLALLLLTSALAAAPLDEWRELARPSEALDPTPAGDGHLGPLPSGEAVRIRLPVPADEPLAYGLQLGANVVGYSGKGTAYRLVVRRDGPEGPVVHEGPTIADGDEWNASNRSPIDLTDALTPADRERGYLDLWVAGIVEGDDWTLYRNSRTRRIAALVVLADEDTRAAIAAAAAMRERGIALIPLPRRIDLSPGALALADGARIVLEAIPAELAGDARFAADDLAEVLAERVGVRPAVVAEPARPGDIVLAFSAETPDGHDEGYRVVVDGGGARGYARTGAGLFYAACTLGQLAGDDGALPHCAIDDWPAFPLRGIQYDVARGQTVEVEWWERVIRLLARCKLNAIMIYGENDYQLETFPFLGREGTFTREKAQRLTAFAERYHVQLIPQFEALGHASAVLRAEEVADLREGGNPWVFATLEPRTWEFLDQVFAELDAWFPNSDYLHIGGDEFEHGFAISEASKAYVAEHGLGALYALHMRKLAELCDKHGRTMLFWPSHRGPSDELSWMTLRNAGAMPKDSIPTEWIYHGPTAYPELEQYQQAGFVDVWAAPSVVSYSVPWPDYTTTYRAIRGFFQAGEAAGIGGAMTTTWEFMRGAQFANSLPGLVYAADQAWTPGRTTTADFERRLGQWLYGLAPADQPALHDALIQPWPRDGLAAWLNHGRLLTEFLWPGPEALWRDFVLRRDLDAPQAAATREAAATARARVAALQAKATRNRDLLDPALTTFAHVEAMAALAERLMAVSEGVAGADAAGLRRMADELTAAGDALDPVLGGYETATRRTGHWAGDRERTAALIAEVGAFADRLRAAADQGAALTSGALGLPRGKMVRLGIWQPDQMSETGADIRLPIDPALLTPGTLQVEWQYTRGAHGVSIDATRLMKGEEVIAEDVHAGWAGAGSRNNLYTLEIGEVEPGADYAIVGRLRSSGGTDSSGEVWGFVGAE